MLRNDKFKIRLSYHCFALQFVIALLCTSLQNIQAQSCPPNIDFESGTFNGWTCYTGFVAAVGGQNVISIIPSGGPVNNRHTMYTANQGNATDPYGGFPVNCPNGSGHSIRLGNDQGGGEAEGISYEFTIPANENVYNLIYNYAVVFQDPNHQEYEQPRMQIEITNVTDNTLISCSSFSFHPYGSPLPGFKLSDNPGSNTPVWYKDWSAVSINLSGNAGKTIRLFFKTADCTFRRHFGYAYIDVNSECSGTFVGATYCPGDTLVKVIGPYGYQSYAWYDSSLTTSLGNQQTLVLQPPPPSGTTVAVKIIPYDGYGCPQTLYAQLVDTLTVVANAGNDTLSCNHSPVQIGARPKPGLIYSWQPAAGLSSSSVANPFASPDTTTTYILTTTHDGGGCLDVDTVVVRAGLVSDSLFLAGKSVLCSGRNDSAILSVLPADSIQWFKDNIPISGAHQTRFKVTQTGVYFAKLFSRSGCNATTRTQEIFTSSVPVAGVVPASDVNQCLVGNNFIFTNTSTNAIGAMQYLWTMGDSSVIETRDASYTYKKAGIYHIKMVVSSNTICKDSSAITVQVYQNAIADFRVDPICINLPMQPVNNTVDTMGSPISYTWNFGNGRSTSNLRTPPAQTYTAAGAYPVTLSVNTAQCPSPLNTARHIVVVDKPQAGISYPVQYAVVNLPLTLQARQLGESFFWSPGISLSTRTDYTTVFKGQTDQTYTIDIKNNTGCVTVDTQVVKTVKNVEIYVPAAFTPNSDGTNDYLRPVLMGIKNIRYFKVFSRWGQLLFESRTERPGWDGTYNGVKQGTQTVVWMIEADGIDGNTYMRKGTSVLIR